MDCGLRVVSLTWESSRAAQAYVLTAENYTGLQVGLTTNTTSAQISELECGQQYYFKVSSVGQGCMSNPSNTSILQTGGQTHTNNMNEHQHHTTFSMQTCILK